MRAIWMARKNHRRSLGAKGGEWLFAGYSQSLKDVIAGRTRKVMRSACRLRRMSCSLTGGSPSTRAWGTRIAKSKLTAAKSARNNKHFTGDSKQDILRASGHGVFRLSQSASLNAPRQKAVTPFVPRD